jgi:hypothetical protein
MTSLREIKERGYLPPKILRQLLFYGTIALLKIILLNMGKVKNLSKITPTNAKYVRPKRRYDLPIYKDGMKYCDSKEKYLRPTLYCNSHAPEIIALAHELGAYKKSDREFAEAAFEFAKRKVTLEMVPLDGVDNTLQRGTGTCLHEISLFVALCRAAGIKSRYKLYSLTMLDTWTGTLGNDEMVQKWSNAMGYFLVHGEGEAFIDGEWVVCDVGPTPERQAAGGIPITKFGEDSIGVWLSVIPGTIMQVESIPYGLNAMMKFVKKIAPVTVDNINGNILNQINIGIKILTEKGEEAYDLEARKSFKPKAPSAIIKKRNEIIFKK